jgi:hypothetical protein
MGFLVVGTWGLAVAFGLLFIFVRFIPLSASFSLCTYALGHDSMIEAFCRSFCCSRSHCDLSVERERGVRHSVDMTLLMRCWCNMLPAASAFPSILIVLQYPKSLKY